jgi:hypothetical protein
LDNLLHAAFALAGQLVVHDHQAVGRADEEVNPADNSLAVVQPCGDGVFGAELAAGPLGRESRKQILTEMRRASVSKESGEACRKESPLWPVRCRGSLGLSRPRQSWRGRSSPALSHHRP